MTLELPNHAPNGMRGERDRVMSDAEEGAIRKVLVKKEEHLIFTMALETAMRLSEMFTLKRKTSTSKS